MNKTKKGGSALSEHYYSALPSSKHQLIQWEAVLRGQYLIFKSDAGVFSKGRIDTGTKILIEAVPLDLKPHNLLDLGCGYGPIGLTLAKLLPDSVVYMSDINERAVELARENATQNGIRNVVIQAGSGFSAFPGRRFELILTNPPVRAGKDVIYPLIEQGWEALRDGGWFAAVMLTRQGAKSFEDQLQEVFGNVCEWDKGSGYRVMASQK